MTPLAWLRERIRQRAAPPPETDHDEFIREARARSDAQARRLAEIRVEMMRREANGNAK